MGAGLKTESLKASQLSRDIISQICHSSTSIVTCIVDVKIIDHKDQSFISKCYDSGPSNFASKDMSLTTQNQKTWLF